MPITVWLQSLDLVSHIVLTAAVALGLAGLAYLLFAMWRVAVFFRSEAAPAGYEPPVTILKPIFGLDCGLYENLRSFCDQDYPTYQVIFIVKDAHDPAVEVIERLIADFPGADLFLAVNATNSGPNHKVSNLAHGVRFAKHDIIVCADSDMRAGRDYLAQVVAPLRDPGVGAVTCLYEGSSTGGLASALGSLFINAWFLPSVLVSCALQELQFCFGATIAVKRVALDKIGGFEAVLHHLADDYMLGALIVQQGFRVRLSRCVVENIVHEPSLGSLLFHELRWAKTVRSVEPLGYFFSFLTYTVPVSMLAGLAMSVAGGWHIGAIALIAASVALRVGLHYTVQASLGSPERILAWLVPLRDWLCFAVWGMSYFGRHVHWRGQVLELQSDGHIALKEM